MGIYLGIISDYEEILSRRLNTQNRRLTVMGCSLFPFPETEGAYLAVGRETGFEAQRLRMKGVKGGTVEGDLHTRGDIIVVNVERVISELQHRKAVRKGKVNAEDILAVKTGLAVIEDLLSGSLERIPESKGLCYERIYAPGTLTRHGRQEEVEGSTKHLAFLMGDFKQRRLLYGLFLYHGYRILNNLRQRISHGRNVFSPSLPHVEMVADDSSCQEEAKAGDASQHTCIEPGTGGSLSRTLFICDQFFGTQRRSTFGTYTQCGGYILIAVRTSYGSHIKNVMT